MNDEGFINPRTLIESLNVINARGERAEDSAVLVEFAEEALRKLRDRDAFVAIKNVTSLLSELGRFGPNNEAIFHTRELANAWRSELVAILDFLMQSDLATPRFDVSAGYFYYNDSAVRFAIQRAVGMLSGYLMPYDEIVDLARKEMAGKGEFHETRLTWVLHVLSEGPVQLDVSGVVGQVPKFDRPSGGGLRRDQKIALAHACRRLNFTLPEFAKRNWSLQTKLLKWAGLGEVARNQAQQAVDGNRRRME